MSKDRVVWLTPAWGSNFKFGFCPSEKAWVRELKRLGVPLRDVSYPDSHACMTPFGKNDSHDACSIVTITDEAVNFHPAAVVGLLAHEATHVWQSVCDYMDQRRPTGNHCEFEAYAIQSITQQLVTAYCETREDLFRRKTTRAKSKRAAINCK